MLSQTFSPNHFPWPPTIATATPSVSWMVSPFPLVMSTALPTTFVHPPTMSANSPIHTAVNIRSPSPPALLPTLVHTPIPSHTPAYTAAPISLFVTFNASSPIDTDAFLNAFAGQFRLSRDRLSAVDARSDSPERTVMALSIAEGQPSTGSIVDAVLQAVQGKLLLAGFPIVSVSSYQPAESNGLEPVAPSSQSQGSSDRVPIIPVVAAGAAGSLALIALGSFGWWYRSKRKDELGSGGLPVGRAASLIAQDIDIEHQEGFFGPDSPVILPLPESAATIVAIPQPLTPRSRSILSRLPVSPRAPEMQVSTHQINLDFPPASVPPPPTTKTTTIDVPTTSTIRSLPLSQTALVSVTIPTSAVDPRDISCNVVDGPIASPSPSVLHRHKSLILSAETCSTSLSDALEENSSESFKMPWPTIYGSSPQKVG